MCWEGEHPQRRCPRKGDIMDSVCYNCGRRGRSMVTCERCQDVHTRFLEREALKSRGDNGSKTAAPATITSDEYRRQQDSIRTSSHQVTRPETSRVVNVTNIPREYAGPSSTSRNNSGVMSSSLLTSVSLRDIVWHHYTHIISKLTEDSHLRVYFCLLTPLTGD